MLVQHVTSHFKAVQELCSRADVPLSAYPLLVQALRNDLNAGFTPDFDEVLGEGGRAQIAGMIRERFNMDGNDPSGRKVGLLDRHHLMAFLVDPFNGSWRSIYHMDTPLAPLMREMIDLYVGIDEDGSSTSRDRVLGEFMVRSCVR